MWGGGEEGLMTILEVEDLAVKIRNKGILKNISFSVKGNES